MNITLTSDQESFVRRALEHGRIDRVEDAVTEALLLWEERERLRARFITSLDESRTSIARGEGVVITQESMRLLAEDVKRSGRQHLAAENQASD